MTRRGGDGDKAAKKRRREGETLHDSTEAAHPRRHAAAGRQDELEDLTRELSEAHEHQAAASEVLGIISRSPKDAQPVLDAIVQSAARLCGSGFSIVQLYDGECLRLAATNSFSPAALTLLQGHSTKPDRSLLVGRAIVDRAIVHVHDVLKDPDYSRELALAGGWRAVLAVPMLRDGAPVGAISVGKVEPVPFSERQVRLLRIFADQAVIAIENARMFEEVEARTHELELRTGELTEALQQQTATADVLKAISRSAFDLEAVLQALLDSAIRLCGATRGHVFTYDAELLRLAVATGVSSAFMDYLRDHPLHLGPGSAAGRAAAERRTVQIDDILAEPGYEYRDLMREEGYRTVLAVPLLRNEALLGVITILKPRVEPFTARQIDLVATFADQAVIAIENARLLDELQQRTRDVTEALEYQTAITDVLDIISRSPTNVQPVFDAIVQCASRLCEAEFSAVARFDGELLHLAAVSNMSPEETAAYNSVFPRPPTRGFVVGRAFLEGAPVQVEDVTADPEYDPRTLDILQRAAPYRSYLGIPIGRAGVPIGAIGLGRRKVLPFTERQIELVQTFANQAVIAIENVRLFKEAQDRTRDLTEALEQQTATSAILRVISTSPTEVQPVFETIVRNAVALCGSLFANVFRFDGELLHLVASHNVGPSYVELLRAKYPTRPDSSQVSGRMVLTRSMVRLEDALADPDYDQQFPAAMGWRRMLGVPMLRQGEPVGVIVVGWTEAGPVPKAQEELLKQFADQAVIAIENARLFDEVNARTAELTEALERQTATSEVLGVISRSPTDLQPVLDTIVATAARLCQAEWAVISKLEADGRYHPAAAMGNDEEYLRFLAQNPIPVGRGTVVGRTALEGRTLHLPDVLQDPEYTWSEAQAKGGFRTILGVPLLRGGAVIGVLILYRNVVRPFNEKEIEVVTTFADQAVIAIENVRLFEEVQARTEGAWEGAGAAGGDRRDPACHRELADRHRPSG